MKFDKLVRDNIPAIMAKKGKQAKHHQAQENEYWQKLTDKLQEEMDEFLADQNLEELADMIEVIYAICDHKKFSREQLEKFRLNKLKEKGGFSQKLILDEVKDQN